MPNANFKVSFTFLVVCVFLAPIAFALCLRMDVVQSPRPSHWREISCDGVTVVGSDRFVNQVQDALSLLQNNAPGAFNIVKEYVGVVEEGKRSGMWAYRNPPTYVMSQKTAFSSLSWCASTIAHDSYHSALYHKYKQLHGLPVPNEVWCGKEAEIKCNKHQTRVLKKIGAPAGEIEYMASMDGTHSDLDGDGEYTWKDYWKRDW